MNDITFKTKRVDKYLAVYVDIDGLYEKNEAKELLESLGETIEQLNDFIMEKE